MSRCTRPFSCAAVRPEQNLPREVDRLLHGQRTGVEARPKRFSLEQFRDDVGDAALHTDVVDREDVRMIERADGTRLAVEAPELIGGDRHRAQGGS